jgi:predicted RNase H-like HicB family nuclease
MTRYKLPLEIESLEEVGYLAICPILQGGHAEGEMIAEAIENVEDVARNLIELMREDGIALPRELQTAKPGVILHNEILVPDGAKDIKIGTFKKILRDLAISPEEWAQSR